MEIYSLDVEPSRLLLPLKSQTTSSHVYEVQQGLDKKSPLKNVDPITLERSTPSPSPHPKTQTQTECTVRFWCLVRQEGKQECPVVRGEPLLRNKSTLEKNRSLQGEEHFRKNCHEYLQRDKKNYSIHEAKRRNY